MHTNPKFVKHCTHIHTHAHNKPHKCLHIKVPEAKIVIAQGRYTQEKKVVSRSVIVVVTVKNKRQIPITMQTLCVCSKNNKKKKIYVKVINALKNIVNASWLHFCF